MREASERKGVEGREREGKLEMTRKREKKGIYLFIFPSFQYKVWMSYLLLVSQWWHGTISPTLSRFDRTIAHTHTCSHFLSPPPSLCVQYFLRTFMMFDLLFQLVRTIFLDCSNSIIFIRFNIFYISSVNPSPCYQWRICGVCKYSLTSWSWCKSQICKERESVRILTMRKSCVGICDLLMDVCLGLGLATYAVIGKIYLYLFSRSYNLSSMNYVLWQTHSLCDSLLSSPFYLWGGGYVFLVCALILSHSS